MQISQSQPLSAATPWANSSSLETPANLPQASTGASSNLARRQAHPTFAAFSPVEQGCGVGAIARSALGAAVALPVGLVRGAVKIAMIPVKVAVFAPVGCVTAGAASCVSPPECVPGPVAGVANGLMTGAAVVAFAPVSELMDTPRVAFGEESILRNVYRAIAG